MKKDVTVITTLGLVGITILSGIVLAGSKAMADDSAIDNVNITVPISCTMSSVISSGEEHTATLNPGTYSGASGSDYENGIGKTTLTTFCNDYNGFSIYAVGYTGDTIGNNTLLGTTASGNATIATKVYQSGDAQSNWSMKVTKVSDVTRTYNPANMSITNSFDNWHTVPDTYTKVAEYHASTGSSATDQGQGALGAKVETTYAAYISPTQPADTYSGKVKYTMVHPYNVEPGQEPQPATSGCINYFANASDAVGTMGCQSATDNASVTLLASNFSRAGYGFAGWSDSFDYATNSNAKFYGPNETFTVPTGTTANGLSLYAVWVKSQGSIQDQSKVASVCSGLDVAPTDGTANLKSVSALTDQRDNNTYAIARLADDKCWMIENLRLESTNSDNRTGNLAQGYGGQFAGLAEPEAAWANNITTANSLYSTDGADSTINIGTSDASYRFPRYNHDNTNSRASSPTTNSTAMYSYGNYYTWSAAIADTTAYATNNQSVTGTSICPAGWHLPTGGMAYASGNTSGVNVTGDTNTFREFYNLGYKTMDEVKTAYEDTPNGGFAYYSSSTTNTAGKTATAAFRSFPNNFVYNGYVGYGSVDYRGSRGNYWSSSSANSSNYAYSLRLHSSSVYPGTNGSSKYYGRAVRCVAPGV